MSGGLRCLCLLVGKGGLVLLFNPSHQSQSTSLSYRTIQWLWRLKLALLSACHWLAVSKSPVENQLYEWMPCCSRRQAPGMLMAPPKSTLCLSTVFTPFNTHYESPSLTFFGRCVIIILTTLKSSEARSLFLKRMDYLTSHLPWFFFKQVILNLNVYSGSAPLVMTLYEPLHLHEHSLITQQALPHCYDKHLDMK